MSRRNETRTFRAKGSNALGTVVLRAGREKPLRQRHPWVFSGAIESISEDVEDGDIAAIVAADGSFLGRGMVNRRSQIVARVLTFDREEVIDDAFWESRLSAAMNARGLGAPLGIRVVHAESDCLPGLIVDRYGEHWVIQVSTLGVERHKAAIVRALERVASPKSIYERSDVESRDKEGVARVAGLLSGVEPPELIAVTERSCGGRDVTLLVDVRHGHKTGTYLDQRDNRRLVAEHAAGGSVLNLFSYTGGFGVHAAKAGARHVVNVDSSADALALALRTAAVNGVSERMEHLRADAFDVLRQFREDGRAFDLVVLDPPKFAHHASEVDRAARAYKDLARVAMQITKPNGVLATFSCSGAISSDLFQKITFSASLEAKRSAQIIARLSQPADHPVLLTFPEGEYLKGLVCRVA